MADEAEFRIKVKVGNKDEFKRDLQKMLDSSGYIGGSIKSAKAQTASAGGGGFLGSMMGGLTKMLGAAGVAIMILDQFKGLTNMVSAILRIAIEFLRPVADVIMLLLMPVLMILRPILMVVRQLIAPFRKSAYQLASLGSKAILDGDMTGGFSLMGQSILTMFAGFIPVLTTWWGTLTGIIVDILAVVVKLLAGAIFDVAGIIAKGMDFLTGGIFNLEEKVGTAKDGFLDKVDLAAAGVKTSIDETIADWNKTFTEKVIGAANETIAAAKAQQEAAKAHKDYLSSIKEVKTNVVRNADGTFMSSSKTYDANMSTENGPAYAMAPADGIKQLYSTSQEYFSTDGKIPASVETGYATMLKSSNLGYTAMNSAALLAVGPAGFIPATFNQGFDKVRGSASNFNKAMDNAAYGVSRAVDVALSAASRAVREAQRYAQALRSLEARRS
jgi:hypothetical protein